MSQQQRDMVELIRLLTCIAVALDTIATKMPNTTGVKIG